jgi:hypothetical protein
MLWSQTMDSGLFDDTKGWIDINVSSPAAFGSFILQAAAFSAN